MAAFSEDILGQLARHRLAVRTVPRGHLRIDANYIYPDGHGVSVFLAVPQAEDGGYLRLTDFGNTLNKVAELNPGIDIPAFTAAAAQKVASSYTAVFIEDRLEVELWRGSDAFGVNADRLAFVSESIVRFAAKWHSGRVSCAS